MSLLSRGSLDPRFQYFLLPMRTDLLHPYCSRQHLFPLLKQKCVAAAAVAFVTVAVVAAVAVVHLLGILAVALLPVLYFVIAALFFLDLDHLPQVLLIALKGSHLLHPPLQEQQPVDQC
ncbi:hypothetical protein TcCL_ESM06995 [Trypanosoma cruzi]|nr:hypothetical protein TcCL_ESM06995 [Trypanosoma cruzi]